MMMLLHKSYHKCYCICAKNRECRKPILVIHISLFLYLARFQPHKLFSYTYWDDFISRLHDCLSSEQKKTNTASQWGLSNNCKIFFFFITVILLQRKSQLKRLSTLKTWRRRTFSCFLFRLCIECSKSDHLVLHCYFDLESWLMSEFFSFKIWYYLSFFLCAHLPLCQKNTERTVEFWRSLFSH